MNASTKEVLKTISDPHNRTRQLLRDIKRIDSTAEITKENVQLLHAFNQQLEKDFHKNKLSVSGWQKSISEAQRFCAFFKKPITKLTKSDIEKWFKFEEQRFLDKKITAWTLRKYTAQARKLLRFALKQPSKKYIDCFDWINEELPDKPKRTFTASDLPSQADIKRLLEAMYVEGKRMSIRNRAVIALCNDIGCRVSEALEIRNKDIKPEQNFLVISLPKSKTERRSVISLLARPYLEEWSKISPNKKQGAEAPFFCDKHGRKVRYAVVRQALAKALKKTSIKFPKNKNTHFFRALFASRSYAWGKVQRNYWLGWSNGISDTYSALDYKACINPYMKMLKEEANPQLKEDAPFWEEESIEERFFKKIADNPAWKERFIALAQEVLRT